jgi:hypothetical protein
MLKSSSDEDFLLLADFYDRSIPSIGVPIPGFPDFELGIPKEFLGIWNSQGFPNKIPIPDFCKPQFVLRNED